MAWTVLTMLDKGGAPEEGMAVAEVADLDESPTLDTDVDIPTLTADMAMTDQPCGGFGLEVAAVAAVGNEAATSPTGEVSKGSAVVTVAPVGWTLENEATAAVG